MTPVKTPALPILFSFVSLTVLFLAIGTYGFFTGIAIWFAAMGAVAAFLLLDARK